ncbi:hypothetical protein ACW95P_01885 [Candidatus Mycoplasma pogonae]
MKKNINELYQETLQELRREYGENDKRFMTNLSFDLHKNMDLNNEVIDYFENFDLKDDQSIDEQLEKQIQYTQTYSSNYGRPEYLEKHAIEKLNYLYEDDEYDKQNGTTAEEDLGGAEEQIIRDSMYVFKDIVVSKLEKKLNLENKNNEEQRLVQ